MHSSPVQLRGDLPVAVAVAMLGGNPLNGRSHLQPLFNWLPKAECLNGTHHRQTGAHLQNGGQCDCLEKAKARREKKSGYGHFIQDFPQVISTLDVTGGCGSSNPSHGIPAGHRDTPKSTAA
jgi:hypothetical protein